MCGFAGILQSDRAPDNWIGPLQRMGEAIRHRGPDDGQVWHDAEAGIGFSFRRLAIIDLSPGGRQPMASHSGRYVIIFNGEIYNYQDIRARLADRVESWHGHSDTEVLLAAIEAWGVEKAVKATIGMFAFALWDRQERQLFLGRDRIGVKPLYYGWSGNSFLFGSELKALQALPGFSAEIDRQAVSDYLRGGFIPAPRSIYTGFNKLAPGHIAQLPARAPRGTAPIVTPYWSAADTALAGKRNPYKGSLNSAIEELDALLHDAIGLRMVADVPIGAFLSGGIDSSIVVSIMQKLSSSPIRTFSIGFDEEKYNEAHHAAIVARHLGTQHTELILRPGDALSVIPSLPDIFDEPFADSSQIPTYLVSRLARQDVTVSLSGDGGDEIFSGYERYRRSKSSWSRLALLHPDIRSPLCASMARAARYAASILPSAGKPISLLKMASRLAPLREKDGFAFYRSYIDQWRGLGGTTRRDADWVRLNQPDLYQMPLDHLMMLDDLTHYLPDDVLTKLDRASMSVSLEAREPLLDHRIIEFGWRLPLEMKSGSAEGKIILRRLLEKYVPRHITERPKVGFGVPIAEWLCGGLRDWASDLLSDSALKSTGLLDEKVVRQLWQEHRNGAANWHQQLWQVLMLQAWITAQPAPKPAPSSVAPVPVTAGTSLSLS
jgi:asparagine synthase (glutamine-hydrolysing)